MALLDLRRCMSQLVAAVAERRRGQNVLQEVWRCLLKLARLLQANASGQVTGLR
jgi:hypothetical protein